jgi:nucleotide-binding universal stress UspA family protein
MTHALAFERPLAAAPVPQVGPVLLAMKPANGSPAALAVARWLAAREERGLRVVTVLQQRDPLAIAAGMIPMSEEYYAAERATLAVALRQQLAAGDPAGETRIEVLDGPSARAVVDAAAACSARVIVIGAGGHTMAERHIFGESALQILSLSDRPVLIVPSDAVAAPVSVAVVAVDFSPASLRAARAVFPMLSEHGRLRLVHVRTRDNLKMESSGGRDEVYEDRAVELFKQFQRQLPSRPGVTVDVTSLRGDPTERLIEFAAGCHAGLIACGRLAHSFVERLFVSSVSSDLVRRAACPVLVVPELPGDLRVC